MTSIKIKFRPSTVQGEPGAIFYRVIHNRIARSKNVPLSVISEGMGHDSEATTRIYLASLDNLAIDKANSLILKSL